MIALELIPTHILHQKTLHYIIYFLNRLIGVIVRHIYFFSRNISLSKIPLKLETIGNTVSGNKCPFTVHTYTCKQIGLWENSVMRTINKLWEHYKQKQQFYCPLTKNVKIQIINSLENLITHYEWENGCNKTANKVNHNPKLPLVRDHNRFVIKYLDSSYSM